MKTPKPYKVERKGERILVSLGRSRSQRFAIPCKDVEVTLQRIRKACKEARRFLLTGWKGKMHRSTNEGVGWVEKAQGAVFYLYLGRGKVISFALEEEPRLLEEIRAKANLKKENYSFWRRCLAWWTSW